MSYWGADSGEGEFVFYKGQLLAGCMDKAQFGKFGLVHAMQVGAVLPHISRHALTTSIPAIACSNAYSNAYSRYLLHVEVHRRR